MLRNLPLLLQIFFWYFAVLRALPGTARELHRVPGVFLNNRGLYLPRPVAAPEFVWSLPRSLAGALPRSASHLGARRRERDRSAVSGRCGVTLGLCSSCRGRRLRADGLSADVLAPDARGLQFRRRPRGHPRARRALSALSAYTATYIAEVVRAGILAVPPASARRPRRSGFTRGQTLRLVVIPQAMREIVPPLTSQYFNLTKNSSLAVAIAYPDLVSVFAGTTLNQTGQAIEVIAITMAVYLTISLITTR